MPPPDRRPDQPRRTPARGGGSARGAASARGADPGRAGGAARRDTSQSRGGSPRSAGDRGVSRSGSDDGPRRPRFVEPELADDIDARELDRGVRAGLRSLPEDLATKIARHLVAAGRAIDEDPSAAVAHTMYARNLAPRLSVVREAAGVAAYRNGDFSTALAELRAVRRMTGDPSYLPMMADCERGLGRPERALAIVADSDVSRLDVSGRVELSIVESGARRDRGEAKAAVVALQGANLNRGDVAPWTVRLWYAYAAALVDAGRLDEARQWFESVVTIDEDGETDADERIAELDRDSSPRTP